jgi:endonuclease/exonuclease/phosphatase family metal-dependent hydrolase
MQHQADPGPMPEAVAAERAGLRAALDTTVPAKSLDRNLVIGTWNVRAFGDLADTWAAGPADNPKRDRRALAMITEIVSHFDVVAVQEVKGNLRGLRHMMRALGPEWSFILTDVTRGQAGNDERLAFVFDTRRVRLSGLACELVLSEEDIGVKGTDLVRQFARTPYAVSFVSAGQTFILVTLHVLWGKVPKDRIPELEGIARWARNWADEIASWGHNLIVLGDFNIDRAGDDAFRAFTSTGLHPPPALNDVPRTVFSGKEGGFYDQVAWFDDPSGAPLLSLGYTGRAGGFDFVPHVFTELDRQKVSWRMSDHLPLWCEFSVAEAAAPVTTPTPTPALAPSPSPRGTRPRR